MSYGLESRIYDLKYKIIINVLFNNSILIFCFLIKLILVIFLCGTF